jgi:hypothetical protein
MPIEVAVATLVMALAVSIYDGHAALLYAVVATQISTLESWLVLTLSFFVYWLYKGVARAVRG